MNKTRTSKTRTAMILVLVTIISSLSLLFPLYIAHVFIVTAKHELSRRALCPEGASFISEIHTCMSVPHELE